jgi:FKBP-type peptidyl-prolyl cis-trans isomerase FkpA
LVRELIHARAWYAAFAFCLFLIAACHPEQPAPKDSKKAATPSAPVDASDALQRDRESLYALGSWLARNLSGIKLEEQDIAPIEQGLRDALLDRPLQVDPIVVGERVQTFLNRRRAQMAAEQKAATAWFVEAAKKEPGARKTVGGLIYLNLVEGTGATPVFTSRVKLRYHGVRADGTSFEDDVGFGREGVFSVNQVIPCWMEALQLMRVGGKAKITCTSDLAYGDRGIGGRVLPGAPLQFWLELLEILP